MKTKEFFNYIESFCGKRDTYNFVMTEPLNEYEEVILDSYYLYSGMLTGLIMSGFKNDKKDNLTFFIKPEIIDNTNFMTSVIIFISAFFDIDKGKQNLELINSVCMFLKSSIENDMSENSKKNLLDNFLAYQGSSPIKAYPGNPFITIIDKLKLEENLELAPESSKINKI